MTKKIMIGRFLFEFDGREMFMFRLAGDSPYDEDGDGDHIGTSEISPEDWTEFIEAVEASKELR